MSSTFFYDKQFVKLSDGRYLPFVLSGCSNVYSNRGNGQRRSRDWQMWLPIVGGSRISTADALLESLEQWRADLIETNTQRNEYYIKDGRADWCDTYTDKAFGYYAGVALYGKTTHTTSYQSMVNFITSGIKYAIDFTQLKAIGRSVCIRTSSWCDNAKRHGVSEAVYVTDEKTFLQEFERFIGMYTLDKINFYVDINVDEFEDNFVKNVRNRFFPESTQKRLALPKVKKEVDKFWTVMFEQQFFKKRTSRSIVYSWYNPQMKFETEKQANAKLAKVSKGDGRFSIKLINQTAVI